MHGKYACPSNTVIYIYYIYIGCTAFMIFNLSVGSSHEVKPAATKPALPLACAPRTIRHHHRCTECIAILPNSAHFTSFFTCLRSSAAFAAAPGDMLPGTMCEGLLIPDAVSHALKYLLDETLTYQYPL